jgi:hypothetical protein
VSTLLSVIGFLTVIGGIFYFGMIWLPEALTSWRPRCFPKCKRLTELPHGGFRCSTCGWTKRIDSRWTKV